MIVYGSEQSRYGQKQALWNTLCCYMTRAVNRTVCIRQEVWSIVVMVVIKCLPTLVCVYASAWLVISNMYTLLCWHISVPRKEAVKRMNFWIILLKQRFLTFCPRTPKDGKVLTDGPQSVEEMLSALRLCYRSTFSRVDRTGVSADMMIVFNSGTL